MQEVSVAVLHCLTLSLIGPAFELFEQPYYQLMKKALRKGGIVSSQGMSIYFNNNALCKMQLQIQSVNFALMTVFVLFCCFVYPLIAFS